MSTPARSTEQQPAQATKEAEIEEILAGQRFLSSVKSRIIAGFTCGALTLGVTLAWGGAEVPKWGVACLTLMGSAFGLLLGERVAFILLGVAIGAVTTYFYLQS